MKQRDRILEIARTQLGYKEGPNNDTKYGDWYGLPNNPWCQMFISWCADQAGIGTDIIPRAASCPTALEWFMKRDGRIGDIPAQPDDLVFYEWSGETAARAADHVGIVEKVEGSEPSEQVLTTIEGNYNDNVQRRVVRYRDMGLKAICRPRYTDHEEEKRCRRLSYCPKETQVRECSCCRWHCCCMDMMSGSMVWMANSVRRPGRHCCGSRRKRHWKRMESVVQRFGRHSARVD